MTGKTIRIFPADGGPTGILLAEISNWTGKVLVAPRSQLDQLSKREEVRRTGVSLLVGPDPDDPSRALASIGEGDDVLKRLRRHNKHEAKGFWERTVVIVSEDENLSQGGSPTPPWFYAGIAIVIRKQPSSPYAPRQVRATLSGG